jgi:hypothetical protein
MLFTFWQFFITYNFFWKITFIFFFIKILFAVFNVLFVGYSLTKSNLNNTYQYNMISKKISKTYVGTPDASDSKTIDASVGGVAGGRDD